MKLNKKGFSLIELLVVLVLTSIVLVPLITSFTDSLSINQQSQANLIAATVAESSLSTLEKIDFSKYRTPLSKANIAGDYYLEVDADQCNTIFTQATDQNICTAIFTTTSANLSFDATTMKVFLFDFNLLNTQYNQLIADGSIPISVRDELQNNQEIQDQITTNSSVDNKDVIWAIIWLDYYDNPDKTLVMTGVIANGDA